MSNKHKYLPVELISMDELREKEDAEEETGLFEHKLGAFCEMNTEAIGIRADLSRLFKMGFFSTSERRALTKKIGDFKLNSTERKAYQRAVDKLTNFYTKI
jgi:hypothetical protein